MKKGLLAPLLFLLCAGCSVKTGELVMAVDSDMSIPKDVDQVRILVTEDGVVKHDLTHIIGPNDDRLPGTLGLYDSVTADALLTMRVIAYQNGNPRVVAKAVSSVPDDCTATIRLPIAWLCDGQVASKPAVNPLDPPEIDTSCPDGQSCIAGGCVDDATDSATLPDYTPAAVFGGGTGDGDGTCFDVQACFAGITDQTIDMSDCSFVATGTTDLNVALRTEGDGICGPNGCLIALDKDDTTGWKIDESGKVTLPQHVCDELGSGDVGAVGVAGSCASKTGGVPICGPWSSAGGSDTGTSKGPLTVSAAQDHPISLIVDSTSINWITSGTFGKANGKLKRDGLSGGVPTTLADMLPTPEQTFLTGAGANETIYFTNNGTTGTGDGSIVSFAINKSGAMPVTLASGVPSPVGVAVLGTDVYFTSFATQDLQVLLGGTGTPMFVTSPFTNPVQLLPTNDGTKLYLVEEGTLGMGDGHIWMVDPAVPDAPTSIGANTPHAMAADKTHVYWVEFSATAGAVVSAAADLTGAATTLASSQSFPSSIAVDATNVYWTNLGDGTVWSVKKTGGAPTELASGQYKPAAITIANGKIYWVNQGASDSADGSVVALDPTAK